MRDLVPFAQFKKRENTHRGVLLLVKLQAEHGSVLDCLMSSFCCVRLMHNIIIRFLGLDLVVRDEDGNMINVDSVGVIDLYKRVRKLRYRSKYFFIKTDLLILFMSLR